MAGLTYATASTRTVAAMFHATPIRRDQEGRYCLNDLHRAADGEQRHQPRYWLANEQTKALVTAVSNSGNPLIAPVDLSRSRYSGTYAHEDLAIDYAAWISPVVQAGGVPGVQGGAPGTGDGCGATKERL